MLNITRKVLEDELKGLKIKDFKLEYIDKVYNLYNKDSVIFTGSAKETYIYLQGFKYGLGKNGAIQEQEVVKESESFGIYEYLKNRVNKGFIIEAQKEAKNSYFSQHKNKYSIKIENLTKSSLYFTAKAVVITPRGIQLGGPLNIPLSCVKYDSSMSIDKLGELILKAIDNHILKEMTLNKNLTSDRLLWVTLDTLWYLGWSNTEILTKKVDIKVV